jgi:6-phosphofructokinase 2
LSSAAAAVTTVTLNPTIDVGLEVDRLLVDHKMLATSVRREPGGGGVNVARSLHRLGTDCVAVVGVAGPTGTELVNLLADEEVRVDEFPLTGLTRESVSLTDTSSGSQYRVVTPGPHVRSGDTLISEVIVRCRGCEIVVLSGRLNPGLPANTYRRIADGLPDSLVVVDCAPPALDEALRSSAALIKPSRRELATVVGAPLETRSDVVAAAEAVLADGEVGALVVSLGSHGAVLVERDHPAHFFAAPIVAAVVSTVGCGDAMVAGMVRALELGRPLEIAVGFGVAAGSAAAMSPGTRLFDPAIARALEKEMAPPRPT